MSTQTLRDLEQEFMQAVDSFEDRDDLRRRIATLVSQTIMDNPESARYDRQTIPKLNPALSLGDNLDQYLGLKIPGMSGHLTKTKTIVTGTSSTADRIQCLVSGNSIRVAEMTGTAFTVSKLHLREVGTDDLAGADVDIPVVCRRVTMISSPGSVTTGSALGAHTPTKRGSGNVFSESDSAIGSQINETGHFALYPGGTAVSVCDTCLLGQNVQPPPVRVLTESSNAGYPLNTSFQVIQDNLTRDQRALLVKGTLTYHMNCSPGSAGILTVQMRATRNDGRGFYDRFVNHEFSTATGQTSFTGSIPLTTNFQGTTLGDNSFTCTAFTDVQFLVRCSTGTVTLNTFDCSYTGTTLDRSEGAIILRQSGAIGVCPTVSFFIEEWKLSSQDGRGHVTHGNQGFAPAELLTFTSTRPAVQHAAAL